MAAPLLRWAAAFLTLYGTALALDWNSDIVATDELKRLGNQDALHQYYGAFIEDREMFPSKETMKERIGAFEDVNATHLVNHDYIKMTAFLKRIALQYPDITHLYSAGKSVEGRDLWVIIVSDNPREHELLEPEVKIVANMHGNEVVGREACLFLLDVFTKNYGKNEWITRYVNDTRLHLMPSMNPDGYERGFPGDRMGYTGRENAHGIDLNRNFPAQYLEHIEMSGGTHPEPETEAMMKWLVDYPFVLSTNLHGGSLVANYPWDDSVTGRDGEYTPTKDDVLFVGLAYRYARAHTNMWKTGRRCGLQIDGDTFLNGITNGAGWYHLAGGMQDWQYVHANTLEVTIEMGCFKFPSDDMIPQLWSDHEFSLFSFLEMAHIGVKGIVRDSNGKPVANATIAVENGKTMQTTKDGEYWRLLAPGDHELTFSAYGLDTETLRVAVNGTLLVHNITLPACGASEATKPVIRRGRGSVRITVVGVTKTASAILRQMARDSCSDEAYLEDELAVTIVPDLEALNATSKMIHDEYPAAVLAVADGVLESLVFSPGEKVPRIFHKEAFERSLNAQLGTGTKCDETLKPLHDSKVAQLMDELQVSNAFQVGVGLGCDASLVGKQAAAVAAILKMLQKILTKDAVSEFSVRPSANPVDHFSPQEILQVTSAAMPILEKERGCARRINHPVLRMTQMGSGYPPYTLVMAIEKKTEALVYQMASTFCDSANEDVKKILARSTLVFLPEIPHTQLNCHDYGSIVPFEKLFEEVVNNVPQIDMLMMFGSGGMKVRYINDTHNIAYRMADRYRTAHPSMGNKTDVCNGIPNEREVIRKFAWDDMQWQRPDALLVQTGCCYENGGEGKLWEENEHAIVSSLLIRTKGVQIRADTPRASVLDEAGKEHPLINGSVFIPLEDGHHVFRVLKDSEYWADVSAEISDSQPFHIRELGGRGGMNFALVAMFALALMLACCFVVRGRFSGFFNRKGLFPRSRDGFERVPLYMSEDEDEDAVVDVNKL